MSNLHQSHIISCINLGQGIDGKQGMLTFLCFDWCLLVILPLPLSTPTWASLPSIGKRCNHVHMASCNHHMKSYECSLHRVFMVFACIGIFWYLLLWTNHHLSCLPWLLSMLYLFQQFLPYFLIERNDGFWVTSLSFLLIFCFSAKLPYLSEECTTYVGSNYFQDFVILTFLGA